jgi:hypothetical protein
MTTMVEMAPIKLAAGRSEQDLLNASNAFQQDFLAAQPGFLRRELVKAPDGNYLDIVHWRSEADAQAIMAKIADSPACALFFSVMDMGDGDGTSGVEHFSSLAVYQ